MNNRILILYKSNFNLVSIINNAIKALKYAVNNTEIKIDFTIIGLQLYYFIATNMFIKLSPNLKKLNVFLKLRKAMKLKNAVPTIIRVNEYLN